MTSNTAVFVHIDEDMFKNNYALRQVLKEANKANAKVFITSSLSNKDTDKADAFLKAYGYDTDGIQGSEISIYSKANIDTIQLDKLLKEIC
jgi:hypothetical protein